MSVSVAVLLPAFGSVVPPGAEAEAVLLSVPEAVPETRPVIVRVAVSPEARLSVEETLLPVPDAAVHDPEPSVTHVQATEVSSAETLSVTVAPVTSDGPLLATVTV